MAAAPAKQGAQLRKGLGFDALLSSNSIFEDSDVFEPDRELGSVHVCYGSAETNTGLLLLPPLGRTKPAAFGSGAGEPRLRVVGAPPGGAALRSPDGLSAVFVSEEELEAALQAEAPPAPANRRRR